MNKAFIFDMDGVLIDSERSWEEDETHLLEELFGKEMIAKTGRTLVGGSIRDTYDRAHALGTEVTYEEYVRRYDEAAKVVLDRAHITPGVEVLAKKLTQWGFSLGLVSSSRMNWIQHVVGRLSFKDDLKIIISLHDTPNMRSKPYPDGYIEAFRTLDALPKNSFILEDSNPGIAAGKASGAFTIGFRGNLTEGYEQTGADVYADTMDEVARIVEKIVTQR
ncbi:MAG: HAD family phosphatase [Patescibacteria group bacterium]